MHRPSKSDFVIFMSRDHVYMIMKYCLSCSFTVVLDNIVTIAAQCFCELCDHFLRKDH